jgi:uncharacterized protein YutE (UPF0331/DUF86 family)
MGKFNLTEAAKDILLGEGSKETFDANIKSKMAQRGGEKAPHGEVGADKLPTSTVAGQQDVGEIGQSPEETDDKLPEYTKGTPSATPPGATPPVGSEKDGVGISKPQGQPGETMGRHDLTQTAQAAATDYEAIRDRIAGKLAPQMMQANAGATFQSYAEDMDAMFSGENLSEEFKTKASTIFEAAVLSRVDAIVEEVESQLMEQFDIAVEQVKEEMAAKVDDYLNYMVEEWMKENEVAIEKSLRAEVAEDFMVGLRNLFVEHYIDIPDEKVDVVEELAAKVEELESSLNEQINKGVELTKEINEQKKTEAIYTACEGLTQTQVEKLKSLAENVEFTTETEFQTKLTTLKESYFKADVKVADGSDLNEGVEVEEEKKSVSSDPSMDVYAKAISQTLIK